MGKALTKTDAGGNTTQWGVRIPTSGFPYWLFQGLVIENGGTLANAEGTETYYDSPEVIGAAQYLVDLATAHKVMEPGILDWGATPKDFFEGRSAMVWTTTGNLTNMRSNAPFPFGVAMLPAMKQRGAPTGGGNFYLFKGTSDEQLAAAVDFIKWITAPEQSAKWTMATGYVAPRPATWETETMKAYAADFPQVLVARDQLEFAKAELSTHENQRVTQILNDALAAAITGQKPVEEALKEAQAKAEAVLKAYR
jgi:sn-glycerol 3-phosphate transport system substrate-binding protein